MIRYGLILLVLLVFPAGSGAQDVEPAPAITAPVLVVDPDRLFSGSELGQKLNMRLDAAAQALATENREIEARLEAEEMELVQKRATLQPEAFRELADDFDRRVTDLREAQARKSDLLDRQRNENRLKFLQLAAPVLAQMMRDAGALVILNRTDVFLSAASIDITDDAIEKLNADLIIEDVVPDPSGTPAPAAPEGADPPAALVPAPPN